MLSLILVWGKLEIFLRRSSQISRCAERNYLYRKSPSPAQAQALNNDNLRSSYAVILETEMCILLVCWFNTEFFFLINLGKVKNKRLLEFVLESLGNY